MKFRPQVLLSLFFVVIAAGAAYESTGWDLSARLFPLIASIPLLALSLVQFVLDITGSDGGRARAMDFEFAEGVGTGLARRRTLNIFAWLVGFVLAIWFLGFHIALPMTVFFYLKFQGGESWNLSVALTALAYLFFWGLFDRILHLPFPEPALVLWVEGLLA